MKPITLTIAIDPQTREITAITHMPMPGDALILLDAVRSTEVELIKVALDDARREAKIHENQ
jgi:hypothetical protein